MDKGLQSGRLNRAAIIATFLSSVAFSVYSILVIIGVLSILSGRISGSTFGIEWSFFALAFAFAALWYHKVGSILIILAGAFFLFFTAWTTNHYPQVYLSVAGVYTAGGILHFINAFFLERWEPSARREEKPVGRKVVTKKQVIYIACFVAFGLGLGFWSAWHARYDTPLFLNLPGYWIGGFFAGPVLASVLFWGVVGALLALFAKPKLIACIMSSYLVIFGGLTIWYYWG
jgi:hypothetical protein